MLGRADRAWPGLGPARLGDPSGGAAALRTTCTTLVADSDVCCWIELHVRDPLCAVTATFDEAAAVAGCHVLADRAERVGLGEFAVRAARHRARLGDRDAARERPARAGRYDNPALLRS